MCSFTFFKGKFRAILVLWYHRILPSHFRKDNRPTESQSFAKDSKTLLDQDLVICSDKTGICLWGLCDLLGSRVS